MEGFRPSLQDGAGSLAACSPDFIRGYSQALPLGERSGLDGLRDTMRGEMLNVEGLVDSERFLTPARNAKYAPDSPLVGNAYLNMCPVVESGPIIEFIAFYKQGTNSFIGRF